MDPTTPVSLPFRRPRFLRLLVLPLLAASVASACFTYTEVGIESVSPGEPVRVRVSEQALDRIPAELGRRMQVEGTVVELDGVRLSLLPELGATASDPVSLSVSDIASVARRELSQARTWAAAGIGAALGAALLLAIEGEPAGSEGGPITEFMWGWSLRLGG